nr:peptidylprolyl isomerase [Oscillospiraceae bacterium]
MKKIISFALSLTLILGCMLSLSSCEKTNKMGTGACEYLDTRDISGRDVKYVEMCVEDYGRLVILLDATTAPVTVANFISLVKEGFYDGLTFHRIIKDFMVQGGDPKADGTGGHEDENGNEINIKGEFSSNGHKNDISHKYGVISMARSNEPDSASSQFFICNADASSSLDGSYAAFGYVVEGMSVIDEITEDLFPKTAYADYYNNYTIDSYYQTYKHYVWQYFGNGALESKNDQPVIKYIKVLDSWSK